VFVVPIEHLREVILSRDWQQRIIVLSEPLIVERQRTTSIGEYGESRPQYEEGE
jgi:hypothetical protein